MFRARVSIDKVVVAMASWHGSRELERGLGL